MKFWEKDDELPASNFGAAPMGTDPLQPQAQNSFAQPQPDFATKEQGNNFHQPTFPEQQQQPSQQQNSNGLGKDISLIIAKLDAIKSELDSINQRVQNIERQKIPQQAQKQYRW